MENESIYDTLTDEDIQKLASLGLDDDTMNQILILFECIKEDCKDKALNSILSIFNNKKLETDESLNDTKSNYVLKLLGDI